MKRSRLINLLKRNGRGRYKRAGITGKDVQQKLKKAILLNDRLKKIKNSTTQ